MRLNLQVYVDLSHKRQISLIFTQSEILRHILQLTNANIASNWAFSNYNILCMQHLDVRDETQIVSIIFHYLLSKFQDYVAVIISALCVSVFISIHYWAHWWAALHERFIESRGLTERCCLVLRISGGFHVRANEEQTREILTSIAAAVPLSNFLWKWESQQSCRNESPALQLNSILN